MIKFNLKMIILQSNSIVVYKNVFNDTQGLYLYTIK